MNKKKMILFFVMSLIISSCSRVLDIWFTSEKDPEFNIEASAVSSNVLRVTVPNTTFSSGSRSAGVAYEYEKDAEGEDTDTVKAAFVNGYTYTWGYYIYRADTPYENHKLIGFVARPNVDITSATSPEVHNTGLSQQIIGEAVQVSSNLGSNQYLEYQCSTDEINQKKVYYFRAAQAEKEWECSSSCQCSDTSCSTPCNCNGSWESAEILSVSAWASAQCGTYR